MGSEMCIRDRIRSEDSDARTDIYALGILAFQLSIGVVPFEDESWFELATKIVKEPVPKLRELDPNIPAWFEELVLKSSAKEPERRFQSMEEIVLILQKHQDPTLGLSFLSESKLERFSDEYRIQTHDFPTKNAGLSKILPLSLIHI